MLIYVRSIVKLISDEFGQDILYKKKLSIRRIVPMAAVSYGLIHPVWHMYWVQQKDKTWRLKIKRLVRIKQPDDETYQWG